MEKERLTKEEVLKKKQYVQICSLELENSNYKYSDLALLLNVSTILNDLYIMYCRSNMKTLSYGQLRQ
jgi:hypothetical protein